MSSSQHNPAPSPVFNPTSNPTTTTTTANLTPRKVTIHLATFPTDTPQIHHLFTSYASNPLLKDKLSQQNFFAELAALPGCYEAPRGCVLLAWSADVIGDVDRVGVGKGCDGKEGGGHGHGHGLTAVGCVALRPLPSFHCTSTSSISTLSTTTTSTTQTTPRTAELKRLYTLPIHRGNGIGRRLVLEALKKAKEMGYEEVKLDSMAWMKEAIALYIALGFRRVEPYHGEGEGLVILGRILEDVEEERGGKGRCEDCIKQRSIGLTWHPTPRSCCLGGMA